MTIKDGLKIAEIDMREWKPESDSSYAEWGPDISEDLFAEHLGEYNPDLYAYEVDDVDDIINDAEEWHEDSDNRFLNFEIKMNPYT